MAYRRRYKKRTRRTWRKRNYKKGTSKLTYANPRMIYKAKLNCPVVEYSIEPDGSITDSYTVSLSDIIPKDVDAFAQIYDEFKLTGFTLRIVPRGNQANATAPDNNGFYFYTVIDHTDDNTFSSVDQALTYASCRRHASWKPMKRYVKCMVPLLAKDVNNTPLLQIQKPQWLQTVPQTIGGVVYNDAVVGHTGLKLITDLNTSTDTINLDIYRTYYVQYRNKK